MKTALLFGFATVLFIACGRTHDSPSLHRQILGKWYIEYYSIERYDASSNSVIKHTVTGSGVDIMNFSTREKLYVNFDTAGPAVWTYKVTDAKTLEIEGKKWAITRLDNTYFYLSLNERDSTLKDNNVVYYQLKR